MHRHIRFSDMPQPQVTSDSRVVDRAGRVHRIEQVAAHLVDEPGADVVDGGERDITARKEAEEAVRFQAQLIAAVGQAVVAVATSFNEVSHDAP